MPIEKQASDEIRDSSKTFADLVSSRLSCPAQLLEELSPSDTASVMLLLKREPQGPVLILNKRSPKVRQPGDLCCPGGRVDRKLDRLGSLFLPFPGLPLAKSQAWKRCRSLLSSKGRRNLKIFLAASLREGWEEMGLLPWKVRFLGVMAPHCLRLLHRKILPLVGWLESHPSFRLNWEVERVVAIPIADLLDPSSYANYKIANHPLSESSFPCFMHQDHLGTEVLWGATYRIVESFLEKVLGFKPPPEIERPVIEGRLADNYLTQGRPINTKES